jgi:hypothetical protein
MPKPTSWLLAACLGAALAACHKAPDVESAAQPAPESKPAYVAAAYKEPPRRLRLAIQLIAARTPAHLAPAAPPATEPSHDLYEGAASAPANPAPADAPGFRITVPMCQRAERQSDPLAKTTECAQLLDAAKQQADACKQAFENGDDKYALSPACRQAAGFR